MKTKTTHTPGPWRIGDAGFTVFGPPNGKPAPDVVATGKSRENILLCAAAPELLAALVFVTNALDTEAGGLYMAHIALARAAIAKAKGG